MGLNLTYVDASAEFLGRLHGVEDPEQKRKIIGNTFIEVFEKAAHELGGGAEYLVQGTLYPDVIESVSFKGPSAVIKSHHNVGGLPEKMKLKLVEPLRELFKDEVRAIGRELAMPDEIIDRQPFDWSLTTWLGAYDLAYAMVLDWPTELRRRWEMPVLQRYHAHLLERGVRGYTPMCRTARWRARRRIARRRLQD
jgi:hypothetical protein